MDLEYKSLNKKFKSSGFAAGVDREVIKRGVAMLQEEKSYMDLKFIMEESINGMREVAEEIGLKGEI